MEQFCKHIPINTFKLGIQLPVSINDINLDAVDKLNSLYDSYKEKINSEYDGDERMQYLDALDRQVNVA
jgi:hypothetical protein